MRTKMLIIGALVLGVGMGYGFRTYQTSASANVDPVFGELIAVMAQLKRFNEEGLGSGHPSVLEAQKRRWDLETKLWDRETKVHSSSRLRSTGETADIVAAKYEIARLEQIGLTPAHPAVMRAEERLRMLERKANSPTQEDVDMLQRKATAAKDLEAKKLAEQLRLRAQEGETKSQ